MILDFFTITHPIKIACSSDSDLVQAGHYTALYVLCVGWNIYGRVAGVELATLRAARTQTPCISSRAYRMAFVNAGFK